MNNKKIKMIINSLFLLLVAAFVLVAVFPDKTVSYNFDQVNVTAQVNITGSTPDVLNVNISGGVNITLNAGSTRTVYCNASLRDWNGYNDIIAVNATFYHYLNTSDQTDDRNEHYTNTSCVAVSNDAQYLVNYSCSFEVYYYAYNGTWFCNVTANDSSGFVGSGYNRTGIFALFALNVTNVIDYGQMIVNNYSDNVTANITNFGNVPFNISVLGYGQTQGDGLGFVCQYGSNISVNQQRFYKALVDYNSKITLASTNKDLNITVARQTNDFAQVNATTYSQLFVPPNPFGLCTGTVRFTATAISVKSG
jgi:hypothetical protein